MIRLSGRNAFAAEGGALKRRLDADVFVKIITGAGKQICTYRFVMLLMINLTLYQISELK